MASTVRGTVLVCVMAALVAGCGDKVAPVASPPVRPTEVLAATGPVTTWRTTVLDDGDGPELCLGGVAESLPPQCSGPPVLDWTWADHAGAYEEADGVRWGEFTLVGDWDGTAFTPTEVVAGGEVPEMQMPERTPCSEPAGGWTVLDHATTSDTARGKLMRAAAVRPDHGLVWVDQSINPRWQDFLDGEASLEIEQAMNDPAFTIVNVGVTGDVAAAEAELRPVWGGPLCVYQVANTEAELRRAAEDLRDLPGFLDGGYGSVNNKVEQMVIYDDGSIQAWVDREFGSGVVEISSALRQVSG
ncbi:hypothetical protein CF8_3216 [Nocardioides sp. CF8]|uniref:hypothetical protein n=1 Tax=Nocardioides sp. CF8 TaxID=110319 RepID=UPI00032DFA51|nr:hypothetical protein [Nocardioides sp. CF8]EON22853.1 hypothetical protein CF8_3216 [Nocardioides sp. CF8]